MTSDMITELGDSGKISPYNLFLSRVDSTISLGYSLLPGTVRQPNNVRAFCTGDWKIAQYVDPKGVEKDQWELYCLTSDPIEVINLDDFSTGEIRDGVSVPGMTTEELRLKNVALKKELATALGLADRIPAAKQFTLFQNFPNPFSQQTSISFFIPETGKVRLAVTDLSGNVVMVLLDQTLTPGVHKYTLKADQLCSGIYFFGLAYNQQMMVKKMIVMK